MQGLSAPRVQLERLERAKQHRAAAQMHAQLPRLARLLDYVCVSMAVGALDDGLADLRTLLTDTGVLTCRVSFQEEGRGLLVDPAEAAVAVAITKQVLFCFGVVCLCGERMAGAARGPPPPAVGL